MKTWLPMLTAIISAVALLAGYAYQKNLEKDAELRNSRQEIYSHLITNITNRNALLGRVKSLERLKANPEELLQSRLQLESDLANNERERTEVIASLCLYATDEAIDAYAKYARSNIDGNGGNLGELILALRRSIYKTSHITADEANLTIWYEVKGASSN
jgi:hypothetical protein